MRRVKALFQRLCYMQAAVLLTAVLGGTVVYSARFPVFIKAEDAVETVKETKLQTAPGEPSNLYAQSACLMDAGSGRVLFEKNADKEMPMASTTKIMTLIVTLENADLEDVVTVSSLAARQPDVQLNIREGEKYYLKDLVYSLMLESHNDVAVAIAEHVGGSVEGFAALMNKKAEELGCVHTHFVTPNGLDADGHYTTAVELARIASYAIQNKKFIEITNQPNWNFKEIESGRSFSVSNKNKLLYLMDDAIGIKTGFTGKAGYCFVGAVKEEDKILVSVVLACGWPPNKNYKWADTQKLMSYGLDNFQFKDIFEHGKTFAPVPVTDGQKGTVNLEIRADNGEKMVSEKEISLPMLVRTDEKVKVVYDVPDGLTAPVRKDIKAGSVKYYVGGQLIQEYGIYTLDEVKKIDYRWCLEKIWNRFLF